MSRPAIGTVIEPSVSADISECALEDACRALQLQGKVPRMLVYGADNSIPRPEALDLARKFGMDADIQFDYGQDEWAVHDLEPGEDRTTYWSDFI